MPVILSLLIAASADAGAWRDFCRKYIAAEDPDQYEFSSKAWLKREIDRLTIKEAWGMLSEDEADHLEILRNELRRRE